jgi:6-phosphogluconolactonase
VKKEERSHTTTTMAPPLTLMVGTFTGGPGGGMDMDGPPSESHGIYSVQFDPESGEFVDGTLKLRADAGVGAQGSPSWLRWHPKGLPVLYTNNETLTTEQGAGSVTAYAVAAGPDGVQLSFLNRLGTGGSSPCYVDLHPAGTHLAVANYSLDEVCTAQ